MKQLKIAKDRIIRDIKTLFTRRSSRVGSFWNNNYIEYERNSNRNKHLSVKEYLNKNKPYLSI